MFIFNPNATATITPGCGVPAGGIQKFRWRMHVSLPYPFPFQKYHNAQVKIDKKDFEFIVSNGLDRVFLKSGMPRVDLRPRHSKNKEKRSQSARPMNEDEKHREVLQSVAIFRENTIYNSPEEAFKGADKKIRPCMDYLSEFVGNIHRNVPYLMSWLIYPVSLFDAGMVHHGIENLCSNCKRWHIYASGMTISLARLMHQPLFYFGDNDYNAVTPTADTSNELLAEALMSLYRGMPRLTVLNSYAAVESLANSIFKLKLKQKIIKSGTNSKKAEEMAEKKRKSIRTKIGRLTHKGLKEVCGRSLYCEDDELYYQLMSFYQIRNKVAHGGAVPDFKEAEEGHKLCCEVVRWLCRVGGLNVKEMAPPQSQAVPGFTTMSKDNFAKPGFVLDFIRKLLDSVSVKGAARETSKKGVESNKKNTIQTYRILNREEGTKKVMELKGGDPSNE